MSQPVPSSAVARSAPGEPLDMFFTPRTVAVIGASETPGSVGRTLLWNLISNPFGGMVFPVNLHQASVLGIKAYRDIASVPEPVDLAIIATRAPSVPGIVEECARARVRGAIVISAGFREIGELGVRMEMEIMARARASGMRVIGPNCLGVMSPITGLNASMAGSMPRQGEVAFISQSGALCTAVLDWSLREMVGFSHFISIGSMADVGWGDLIDHLGDDPRTRSIVLYMESIGDARAFLSAAREVTLSKPILVLKAGRSAAAARAAASHTGALTGRDEVLDAAFLRSGVLRVGHISDLFYMAEVLAKQPRAKGPRLAVVTNSGGAGVLATDNLIAFGGKLAELSPETLEQLDRVLPEHWSRNNPIDILGDAGPERYAQAVEIAAKDPNCDGMLVILTPQALTDPTRTAEQLRPFARLESKPILASWMGGADVAAGESILNRANIPTFNYPDTAARAFCYIWRYSHSLRALYETPVTRGEAGEGRFDRAKANGILREAGTSGRTLLTESESKRILSAYGIPVLETFEACSEEEAARAARNLGFPVVLKLLSSTVTHKSDVGGVHLNLCSAAAVRKAFRSIEQNAAGIGGEGHFLGVTVQPFLRGEGYEIILGSVTDPQFGPVLLFGSGGRMVEVHRDRAHALPPLNTTLARRLMERTRIFRVLHAPGAKRADLAALGQLLVSFSQMIVEQPRIREVDVNPLFVGPERIIALDARILLHGPDIADEQLPRPAIRPYPKRYVAPWKTKSGRPVTIRPIRPEDEPLMVKFHETLSERSVYLRYFHPMRLSVRTAHERLMRICFIDYSREMALVADHRCPDTGAHKIWGVGRLIKLRGGTDAEYAIIVSDQCQREGLGRELLSRLIGFARDEKLVRLVADILPENHDMLRVSEKLGFTNLYLPEARVVKSELVL